MEKLFDDGDFELFCITSIEKERRDKYNAIDRLLNGSIEELYRLKSNPKSKEELHKLVDVLHISKIDNYITELTHYKEYLKKKGILKSLIDEILEV